MANVSAAVTSCEATDTTLTGDETIDAIAAVCLLTLSGLFSGLTLGLMSLDVTQLQIIIDGGEGNDVGYAQTVLPLRRKGNLLLCTLLLGNTLVNALIAILSASFTSGAVGALVSTGFIVIFGEIMPQSVCSRYGLMIGAQTTCIVKIFIVILYPVAKPISLVLDKLLGDEMGTFFTKKELEQLVELHEANAENEVSATDKSLLKGALNFSSITVGEIMTARVLRGPGGYHPGIFMLDVNGRLDFDTILQMYKRGHTRVPVCDGSPENPQSPIVGLLLTKDLMLVDPDEQLETRTLLHYCGRHIRSVSENMTLNKMLELFITNQQYNQTHLFFVQPNSFFEGGRQTSRGAENSLRGVIGLVTLEDVLEELIQREIIDETDQFAENTLEKAVTRGHREKQDQQDREAFFRAMVTKGGFSTTLSEGEAHALVSFLCMRLEPLIHVQDTDRVLKFLLAAELIEVDPAALPSEAEAGSQQLHRAHSTKALRARLPRLYIAGAASEHCTVVLSGRLKIAAGVEGFTSEVGSFSIVGAGALTATDDEPYITDFSATVVQPSRLLRISRALYRRLLDTSDQLQPMTSVCQVIDNRGVAVVDPSAEYGQGSLAGNAVTLSPGTRARRNSRTERLAKLSHLKLTRTISDSNLSIHVSPSLDSIRVAQASADQHIDDRSEATPQLANLRTESEPVPEPVPEDDADQVAEVPKAAARP